MTSSDFVTTFHITAMDESRLLFFYLEMSFFIIYLPANLMNYEAVKKSGCRERETFRAIDETVRYMAITTNVRFCMSRALGVSEADNPNAALEIPTVSGIMGFMVNPMLEAGYRSRHKHHHFPLVVN